MSWFTEQPGFIGLLQILLDITILIALFLFFFLARRQSFPPGTNDVFLSFEKIIEETRSIGREFDANLQERQDLIQQILTKLEQKVQEAQRVSERLDELLKEQPAVIENQDKLPLNSDHKKVLLLFQKGMDAKAIAKRLQKPIGEIELILDIQRLSSDR